MMGRQSLYDDLKESRAEAFADWKREKDSGKDSEALVSGKLGLQDAVRLALKYNKTLQQVLQDKAIARGKVVESYSAALPKVSLGGAYTRLDEEYSPNLLDNYSAELKIVQPVFSGGAIPGALRAARLYAALSDETVRGAAQGVIYAVSAAYYDTVLAEHLYQVNLDAVTSSEAHLSDVQKRRQQGVASDFDVLRAQVEVSNFRAEMIQQRNRSHLAKTSLFRAMGVSQQSDAELADDLSYMKMQPVLEEAVRLAHENRPDLYQAELGVRLQREALTVAKSSYWPSVAGFFTDTWSKPDARTPTVNEGEDLWTAGVQVNWNIFDGLSREGKVMQEKATLKQKHIALLDTQENAMFEVQQAILALKDAEEFVDSQRLNLDRAKEGLRLAQVGYREGVNTEVEVLDARAALTQAKGLYYQAIHTHTLARLNLKKSMGVLGPGAGNDAVPEKLDVPPASITQFETPAAE
jgi:outer membrane protein TolC